MTDVLARSSNVGAIQVGLKVGEQTLYEYVRKFGFGSPTGIELPAESSGMVRRLKAWSKSSIGSVAMGHEISATTLQLAQACAIVANGGVLVRPRIVLRCGRSGARFQSARQDKQQVVLTPENAVKLQAMMEEVVKSGTGKKAQLDGYRAAGKTGSAQIFDFDAHAYTHRYNASFMGFAPVTNPAVVVVVTLNGASQYGGAVAAPVFREVASAALRILDVPRDPSVKSSTDREGGVNDLPAANLGDAPDDLLLYAPQPNMGQAKEAATGMEMAGGKASGARTPDFLGKSMRDVFQQAAARGIPVQATGRGVVKRQLPPPGAILTPGASVWVELGR
jgi:cell division protein FtsI (penicillin-binding protein 3)